jgi:hypothetical protein
LWREPSLWAVVLGVGGLFALFLGFSVCDQAHRLRAVYNYARSREVGSWGFLLFVGASAAEVAAVTLGFTGLRSPGMKLLPTLGRLAGVLAGVLALLVGLFYAFFSLFGLCTGDLV